MDRWIMSVMPDSILKLSGKTFKQMPMHGPIASPVRNSCIDAWNALQDDIVHVSSIVP